MGFILKIVEGPNKGAEIALVEGLCVTLGKDDACDIILADPTLPDGALQIEAAADGVSIETPGEGRRHVEPYHVIAYGSTSLAFGPAGTPWPALVFDKSADETQDPAEAPTVAAPAPEPEKTAPSQEAAGASRRRGFAFLVRALGILAGLVLVVLAILAIWAHRARLAALMPAARAEAARRAEASRAAEKSAALDALVAECSLVRAEHNGRAVLRGDFATRASRLEAVARAYDAAPGIELDFSDAESLKAAVEETLALVGESSLGVVCVTNRVAALLGKARKLRRALEALAADVPKLAGFDCSNVEIVGDSSKLKAGETFDEEGNIVAAPIPAEKPKAVVPTLPVCGILTSPYPCLVMKNGARILEGAPLGDGVVVKIEPDAVTITNSAGRIVWKP